MPDIKTQATRELSQTIEEYDKATSSSKYKDLSGLPETERHRLISLLRSVLTRWSPTRSSYLQDVENTIAAWGPGTGQIAIGLYGSAQALLSDYQNGRLQTAAELIHADLFADYLEMAEYLLKECYKDPAAVIVGSSLEAHLRKLCEKHEIGTTKPGGASLKASAMNDDLKRAGVYDKNEHKQVTAWLGIRNDAAHGDYDKYDSAKVEMLLMGVRNFISRYPA